MTIWMSREWVSEDFNEHGHLVLAPELVVEVISLEADNERRDRETKLALYSREGVEEYWIVDPTRRNVLVYRKSDGALRLTMTHSGADALESRMLPGFSLPITRLWATPWASDL